MRETVLCQRETRAPAVRMAKFITLGVSLISPCFAPSLLWRPTCFPPAGTFSFVQLGVRTDLPDRKVWTH
jgi:hypothetical protein